MYKPIDLAALAKRVAGGWQPMKTAPLHESILMQMKHGIIEGSYDGKVGFGYYWHDMEWHPTAWMPLPDAAHQQAELKRLIGPLVKALEKITANHPDGHPAYDDVEAMLLARQALAALATEGVT